MKPALYARAGIPEVWLVDLKAGRIVRYRAPAGGAYRESETLADLAAVPVPGPESIRLDLSHLL